MVIVMITVFGTFPWNATQPKEGVSTLGDKRAEKNQVCACVGGIYGANADGFLYIVSPSTRWTSCSHHCFAPSPPFSLSLSCIIAAWSCSSTVSSQTLATPTPSSTVTEKLSVFHHLFLSSTQLPPHTPILSAAIPSVSSWWQPSHAFLFFSLSLPRLIVLFDSVGVCVHVSRLAGAPTACSLPVQQSGTGSHQHTWKRKRRRVCAREGKQRDCRENK